MVDGVSDAMSGAGAGPGGGEDVPVDLRPAARRAAAVVTGVGDDQLGAPTPCTEFAVRDLLRHIGLLAVGLQRTARKEVGEGTARAPGASSGEQLPDDWRESLPHALADLAVAWSAPDAWTGSTQAGGITLTGTEGGLVTLDELVVHGWDLARATGQEYELDEPSLRAVHSFLAGAVTEDGEQGIFGPVVHVGADAPLLDRIVGLAGRNPGWSPPS
ncbi:TIGR03086 family metal-binding protein [Streptomyces sp. NPDC006990]|uniref:TIGR03086 family metal-binding protein n=1 Tax=unclassified Streptomyces TaxID=2593676 RepID=UPI003452584D